MRPAGPTLAAVAVGLLATLSGRTSCVSGHGAVVSPLTRNAADRYPLGPNLCLCANATPGTASARSTAGCANGQACYWYQQGCFIGCKTCDHVSGRVQADICKSGKQPTNNNPQTCTVNRRNVGHPTLDIYRHNPWRAPGSAPVVDSWYAPSISQHVHVSCTCSPASIAACTCISGLAGGTPWGWNMPEAGDYVNTSIAHHGDFGSEVLPKSNSRTLWKIGGDAEVIWQVLANHGAHHHDGGRRYTQRGSCPYLLSSRVPAY